MAKRRSLDQTRQILLEAGKSLVREFDEGRGESTAGALAHIRAADVASRAGLSKGMVYHLWDDQDAYRHDLLIHVAADMANSLGALEAIDVDETGRDVLNGRYRGLAQDPSWRLFVELCSYMNDPAVREPLRQGFADVVEASSEKLLGALAEAGLQLKPEISAVHVIRMIQSIDAGFRLMSHMDSDVYNSESFQYQDSSGWSLYAVTLRALIDSLTDKA